MPKFGLILILFLLAGCAYGQQEYFVLIQTENNQPFYVRMGEKTLSSTPQGHVIIPELKDSVYGMTIGFPKRLFPEQDFFLIVDHKDMEFQLRNVEGKGWGLFNPENRQLLMPAEKDTAQARLPPVGIKEDDAFSRMMAGVVNDTAVMYNTYSLDSMLNDSAHSVRDRTHAAADSAYSAPTATIRPVKDSVHAPADSLHTLTPGDSAHAFPDTAHAFPDTAQTVKIVVAPGPGSPKRVPPSKPANPTNPPNPANSTNPANPKKPHKPDIIAKLSEQLTATGLSQAYTDHVKGHKTDTIQVLIPTDSISQTEHNQQDTSKIGSGPYPGAMGIPGGGKKTVSSGKDSAMQNKPGRPVVVNSDCRNFATDGDIDKLKSKMMASATDEARISVARKAFKTKCFSTTQLRALSGVFSQEAARYDFLEKAYPFVSDDRFRDLSDLFADPVYIGKFKTLAGISGP